ncbi:peptidase C13 family-domain-containing protein [Pholiota molesta]|nr:peptidase C13 family-domain-containing protein [Pholiota molesta]
MANALGMYRTVKRLGIPDSNIILMLADDASCNSRNKVPGSVYASPGQHLDLYGDNIEVDYRGYEVTVENFTRVFTGRMDSSVPRSKRLLSNERSNVFVYMIGHGGNEFLKFQDNEEISAFDIADAFEQMYQKRRYNKLLFIIDTCQANTMYSKPYSPNILATSSSRQGENSYPHASDSDIGVAVIDEYTHFTLEFKEKIKKTSQASMQELFDYVNTRIAHSRPDIVPPLVASPDEPPSLIDEVEPLHLQTNTMLLTKAQNMSDNAAWGSPWLGALQGKDWKTTRAWASVAIIGALAGWVTSKK